MKFHELSVFAGKLAVRIAAYLVLPITLSIACVSCGPFPDARHETSADLVPPIFLGATTTASGEIELAFNEEVTLIPDSLIIKPELSVRDAISKDNKLIVTVSAQEAGAEYRLEAGISDKHTNTSNVLVEFYGYNSSLPGLLINEFITNGSETHPDLVEIKVLKSGNMAGIAVYAGTRDNWDSRLIFPAMNVLQGDFLLVHWKPQGIATEVNETGSKAGSSGLDASSTAYDFWVPLGNGLSGSNGTISIYSSPTGTVIDGVLYSNRTKTSDTLYLGFGTDKMAKRALALVKDFGWKPSESTVIPDDGVDPDTSTSTRSICRNRIGTDTDTKTDWHIVPTRKSSFGSENSDEIYTK